MPLDGHSYLIAQGWTGQGTGLRQGAISRPLAIPKKKNLAGLGKDRDEAFPFWDHLFSAAAKSIQLKLDSDSDDSDAESSAPEFKRTKTGILSNRRPVTGVSASASGLTTPNEGLRVNLLCVAKREAAKRGLYARFFRGPVLGPDDDLSPAPPKVPVTVVTEQPVEVSAKVKGKKKADGQDAEDEVPSSKKRKRDGEGDAKRRERKERKERKEQKALRRERKAAKKSAAKSREDESEKEKKRRRRELKERGGGAGPDDSSASKESKAIMQINGESRNATAPTPDIGIPLPSTESRERSKKKKRKRTES